MMKYKNTKLKIKDGTKNKDANFIMGDTGGAMISMNNHNNNNNSGGNVMKKG